MTRSSRLAGFYKLPLDERRARIARAMDVGVDELSALDDGGLDLAVADDLIENVIGISALPVGLGLNFRVNGRDYLVPMCVEEPSVVAAASNAAKLVRAAGGFHAEAERSIMSAQVELRCIPDPVEASARIAAAEAELLAAADLKLGNLLARGGGARGVSTRVLAPADAPDGAIVVVHIDVDVKDAMGANMVNSVAEALAPRL
ncbi:MAG TPA: hypothetical protein VFX50_08110, partial [Gemmatimonadales bacterium]|nr:hypothetical protein [Gemmatimonadales bacterium]